MFSDSKWWEFCIVAFFIFVVCVAVNYIIKKVNEARIEERLSRLLQKTSVSTQVQEPILAIESIKPKPLRTITHSNNSKRFTGISLVFNKEENMLLDIKRQVSTLLVKKSKSNNMEEILQKSQDEEDALFHKISVISVMKNKTDKVRTKSFSEKTISMVIKDSNEICVPNNCSSRLSIKPKEIVQKVSSGSLKLLNLERKLNLTASFNSCKHKSDSNNVNDSYHVANEKLEIPATNVDHINTISQKFSSSDLATHILESKSSNYNLECVELNKFDDTINDLEHRGSNLVDILKQDLWNHVNSVTNSEFNLCKSKQSNSKLDLTTIKLYNVKSNSVTDTNGDNCDSIESEIGTTNEKMPMEYKQETKKMLLNIISSNCLITHKLEAKVAKTNISDKNAGYSNLDFIAECHELNNIGEINSKTKITVNPLLHSNECQLGKNDQTSLIKHSRWHPNNSLTITNSHIPRKSEEIVTNFIIDDGELNNQIITLKNESQNSYVSNNYQQLSHDSTKNTHQVRSHGINIVDFHKTNCSEPNALSDKSRKDLFHENANDKVILNDTDCIKNVMSLENNNSSHRSSCGSDNGMNNDLKKLSEDST